MQSQKNLPLEKQIKQKNTIKKAIRDFFDQRDYLECETPIVVSCPGTEIYLNYFCTHWLDYNSHSHKYWLRSSPELHMKILLSEGLPRIFQIAKCFRNKGELSPWHMPEFTMLEWYHSNMNYKDFMSQTQDLILFCAEQLKNYFPEENVLELPESFDKISVFEAFEIFAGIELHDKDPELSKKARAKNILSVQASDDFETSFFKILIEKVEPQLAARKAVFLYDYPASQAALAKLDKNCAKRFELYLQGIEISNAFSELICPRENRRRIKETNKKRKELGLEVTKEDPHFYQALEKGIPESCGNALGLERLSAVLLAEKNLDSQQFFAKKIYPSETNRTSAQS